MMDQITHVLVLLFIVARLAGPTFLILLNLLLPCRN